MIKTVLFDLDGTLTDPKIGITTCVQYALHSFGIEEPDLDKLEPFIGPPLRDSFMEFYGFTAEQALTTTDQMQIAQIAQYAPELRACIARNPNTYPALIEWLGQLGDPAINAALASRQ